MWIQTVHIQGFGRFRDTTFEFEEGLNLVEAPNEAGKTTLVKFIEGMLYGFYKPTKRRQYTEDRDLYEPWDQGSYGGVLIYQEGEQQVRIERCFAKNRDTVHIFDQQTGEEMTQLFAYSESYRQVQPASRDMGLSAATFRNTLLISQVAPHPNGPELAAQVKEYLANAQAGGGDDISVERAVKRLRAKITDIGTLRQAKNGQKTYLSKRIQVLEAEQREALQRETELAQVQAAIRSLREKEPLLATRKKQLAGQSAALCLQELESWNQRIQEVQEQMTGMEDSRLVSVSGYEEAVRCSAQVRSARQSWAEAKKAVQEIEAKIQISVENQNELDREIRTAGKGIWGNRVLQWTGLACCALFLLLSFIFEKPVLALGALPALILFFVSIGSRRFQANRQEIWRQRQEQMEKDHHGLSMLQKDAREMAMERRSDCLAVEEKLRLLLEQAGVDSIEEYRRCLERKIACQKLMDKQEMLAEEKSRWLKQKGMPESMDEEEFQVELEEAARTAPAVIGSAELDEQLAVYERELEAWKLEMERLKEKRRFLREGGRSTDEIEEELEGLRQEWAQLDKRQAALKMAVDTIEELSSEMERQLGPALNDTVQRYVENLTSQRYGHVRILEEMKVMVQEPKEKRMVALEQLSAGTVCQIYFALRLGMAEILTKGRSLPLILDDVLGFWDEERLGQMLQFLNQEQKKRQILLMTCQEREGRRIRDLGIPCKIVTV